MILPIFNLAKEIKLYNEIAGMKFKETEDFGCVFLNRSMLAATNATISLINEGFTKRLLSETEKAYLQKRNDYLKNIKEFCSEQKEKPAGIINPVFEQGVGVKYYNYIWLHLQQQILAKEETWQHWLNVGADRAKKEILLHLKANWMKQQAFSCHDNEAIYQIAFDLLPSLIKHHKLALNKLNWSRLWIPTPIYKAYKDYLKQFIMLAKQCRTQLAHSMYERLSAWDNNHNNVTTHFIHQLEQNKVALTSIYKPLPKVKDKLNNHQFTAFHAYISHYGDKPLKASIKTLSWCQSNKKLIPTTHLSFKNGLIVVPQAFANHISKKRRTPNWLYKGANIRHEFFKDKNQLLIKLNKAPDVINLTVNIKDAGSLTELFDRIKSQTIKVNTELVNIAQNKEFSKLSSFWQKKTKAFIQQWQDELIHHRHRMLENKVLLADKLAQALNNEHHQGKSSAFMPWETCRFLQALLSEIESDLIQYQSTEFTPTINSIRANMADLFAKNRAMQVMIALSKGECAPVSEYYYLNKYIRIKRISNAATACVFENYCDIYLDKLYEQLCRALETLPFQLENIDELETHTERIRQLYQTLIDFNQLTERKTLDKQLKAYFQRYLTLLANGIEGEQDTKALTIAERVIALLGNNVFCANKTLADHVLHFQSLRAKESNTESNIKQKALAAYLINHKLIKRYDKDLQHFEQKLVALLQMSHPKGLDQNLITVLLGIRDQMISQNMVAIKHVPLTKAQQTLWNAAVKDAPEVENLIMASAYAHQLQPHIHADTPINKKVTLVEHLGKELQKTFHSPQGTEASLLALKSGRLIFTETKINTAEPSANIHPTASLKHN